MLIIPCKTFKHTTTILVKKDGKEFRDFKYFDPRLGFVLELHNKQYEPYFGLYECVPNISKTGELQGMMHDSVKVNVNEETVIRNSGMKMTNERNGLNLNVSGNWVSCTSDEKWRRDYRLVNMRSRNPMEANLKKLCFVGNEECVGKREGSFNRCYSSSRYCKAVDFKEGGGMISCFSRNGDSLKEPHHYVLGLNGKTYINPDGKVVPINALLKLEMQDQSEYYTDILYNISCIGLGYLFAQPLLIHVVLINGTRILVSNPKMFDDNRFSEIYDISSTNVVFNNYKIQSAVSFSLQVSSVSCSAFLWNSEETLEYQIPITVYSSKKPKFSVRKSKAAFILGQTNDLDCDYEALPEPRIAWEKDGEVISKVVSRRLVVSNTTHKSAGVYLCIVTNELGRATKSFTVDVEESPAELSLWMAIGIPLAVVGICVVVFGFLLKYYNQPRNGLSRAEIKEFMDGMEVTFGTTNETTCEAMISSAPYSKEYEVVTGDFVIDETTLLGMGEYGMVYRGAIGERDVAVKTLKPNANVGYLRSLLSELKVMIYLKDHPNVVNLVGANTQHLQKGMLYIMVEFCPLGDIQNYLQKNRCNFIDEFCVSDYDNSDIQKRSSVNADFVSTSDLLLWSAQIASGMEYLAAKNVIHGDLAARNVLLKNRHTAKVSDFGLSRKLYEYSNYVKQSQEPLPWRHLALESLKDLKFSTQSDVWAFGVTLWEIFSLGEVPYPGQNWNLDFVDQLENGLRMRKAKFSNETIFELQIDCWNKEEQKRPTFPAIKSKLEMVALSLNSASS